jgi:gliding motility-associated-like protein
MKKQLFIFLFLSFFEVTFGQKNWNSDYSKRKVFVENIGQFDEFQNQTTGKIDFAADFGQYRVFFTEKGLTYSFLESKKIPREERERLAMSLPKSSNEDYKNWERMVGRFHFKSEQVTMLWGKSSKSKLFGRNVTSDYHSYTYKNKKGEYVNANNVRGFEKVVYKNIYPKIDVEYTVHPIEGIKYAIILHPGANPDDVEMIYDHDVRIENGRVLISSDFGDITDHEPLSFYSDDKSQIIHSHFEQIGNSIKFKLANYDKTKEVVIDPWTQAPNFATNWDIVWECDRDAAGNVYILGGIMPMQVIKYNPAGTIQWTYNTPYDTSNVWLGTFATDLLGNSYITAGSTAQIQKIDNNASLLWNNTSPTGAFSNGEFWTITFNCDQTKLVVGGTGGSGLNLLATVYDINVANGNIITSANLAQGNADPFTMTVQEVRAISASPNGKYYFMTQDTVGAFSQNFNLCSGNPLQYKIDNSYDLGYKCENFRYDNAGICAIRANNSFYYTQNGASVHKRNIQTGAIIATATIPGGASTTALGDFSVSNSGIDLDDCGNVYVGSSTGVVKFDANLIQLATYPTSFKVYDVHVSTSGDIIACGGTGNSSNATRTGGIQSFAAGACSPLAANCCDATICPVQSVCQTDAPINLTAATAGGTWSGPGMSSNGAFNPATAGVGTHTITYTLPCGSETTTIVVSPCQALTACIETNGSVSVSNGVAPYTWSYYQAATSTPITTQAQCTACGYSWFFGQCLNGVTPVTSCNSPAQWTNFATGNNATPPNGVTQVQVTDNSGTVTTFTLSNLTACNNVPCPTIAISNVSQTNVLCNGSANASVTVSANGGSSPYSYNWSPGNLTGASQNNLAAGTYVVTATDNVNCSGTLQVIITQPTALQVSQGNITPATCGSNNGSAYVTVSGGTTPYAYVWTPNVGNTATISNVAGGSYTVVVTDANSCSQTLNLTVPTAGGPTISSVTPTNPTCSDLNSGQIVINASGNGTLQYALNGGANQNSGTFTGLPAGNYSITVTDASGCISTSSTTLTAPQSFTLNEGAIVGSNCGATNGSAEVIVNGGSGNFQYSWQPGGANTFNASNLGPGNYTVSVVDLSTGCTESLQLIVPSIGGPSISNVITSDIACYGDQTGSVSFSATGGTTPYTYSINNGIPQSTATFTNLAAGAHIITVFDATNCPNSQTININEPSQLIANAGNDIQVCAGESVVLTANSTGGTLPIADYIWNQNQNSSTIQVSPNVTSTFNLEVTDNNGCKATDIVTITIIPCGDLEIIVPNVFSPNGDGENESYGIQSINAVYQEAIIVNRWGLKMIELNSPNSTWDGKISNGTDASEGVYFIKYRIVGPDGSEKIGQTFFHLVR